MKAARKVTLGQEVFILSSDGSVVRTRIAKIFADGRYLFLDGTDSRHWFSYDEAVLAATELALAKEKQLRQRLTALRKMRRHLVTDEARCAVMSKPLKVVNLSDTELRVRTRKLKDIKIPVKYFQPGTMVYIAVTPNIRTGKFEYRPYESFILEVPISSVWFTPNGISHAGLSNPYGAEEHFPTREAAMKAHPTISIVVPYEEFKRDEKEFDKLHPVF